MAPTHLLVVEDSPVQAELLSDDLVAAGYEVTVASNGQAALACLDEIGRPDAIISDVMMPEMDGYELCRQVKRERDLREIPVILLTSLRDPVDIVRGLECGADNFVTKPYQLDQLLHRIDTVLRSQDMRLAGRFRMGVEVLVLGHQFTVSAERQQILDMLMSSFEELVNTNDRLREREEELESTQAALQAQVALSEERSQELEDGRDQLRRILEDTQVATWTVDLDTGQMHWSDNAHEVLGVAPGVALDTLEAFLDRIVDEDARAVQQMVDDVVGGQELPDEWCFRVVGDDGRVRWFSARGHAMRNGGVVHWGSGVMMDITHRRELADQLESREQMFRGVLAASPDGIVVTSVDGLVEFASDGIREVLGAEPDELVGQHPFTRIHPDDRDTVAASMRRRLPDDGGIRQMRVRAQHAQGHTVTIDCRVRALTAADGSLEGFVTVVRDVTDQARLEAELEQARDQAEAANRAKSEYLSRMSHELRTPMNSVLGFAQLLELADLQAPEDRESVERILGAGRHLLRLIDDVLDIARIEAGHLTISLEPVAVDDVIGATLSLMQPQVEERHLELLVESAGSARVVADHQRLSQVVINLLSNAIKYNRTHGQIRVVTSTPAPGWCRIAVSDTGPGIADEVRPQLFETFERLGADQTQVPGTGLGLALSKTLVEAMQGHIGCDTELGRGSTFWVDLPVAPDTATAGREADPGDEPATGAVPVAATILYVEDNPLNVELVVRALASRSGTQLRHAASGDVGLQQAREQRPDLVLLDLQLPGMSGRDLLAHLRADPTLQDVPVVVVSADATMDVAEAVRHDGADAYLTKPLDLEELHSTIDGLLRRSTARPDGAAQARGRG